MLAAPLMAKALATLSKSLGSNQAAVVPLSHAARNTREVSRKFPLPIILATVLPPIEALKLSSTFERPCVEMTMSDVPVISVHNDGSVASICLELFSPLLKSVSSEDCAALEKGRTSVLAVTRLRLGLDFFGGSGMCEV